jgi:hypothetical protein
MFYSKNCKKNHIRSEESLNKIIGSILCTYSSVRDIHSYGWEKGRAEMCMNAEDPSFIPGGYISWSKLFPKPRANTLLSLCWLT